MTGYDKFARFYDAVQGHGADRAAYVRELMAAHHPSARTVLELACGTGSILAQLRPDFDVTGLDRSPEMLAIAAAKVPGVRLIEADMTRFELNERFDVVLCIFDSINHLVEFADWEAVFDRAHEHLEERGIFVFDINTESRLAALAASEPLVHWFGDGDVLVMDVQEHADGGVDWRLRIFERTGDNRYLLHAEDIREVSFPRSRIEESLRRRFRRVAVRDQQRARPSAASERLHFVAVT
jgi:SAM-dependent methyltransferase